MSGTRSQRTVRKIRINGTTEPHPSFKGWYRFLSFPYISQMWCHDNYYHLKLQYNPAHTSVLMVRVYIFLWYLKCRERATEALTVAVSCLGALQDVSVHLLHHLAVGKTAVIALALPLSLQAQLRMNQHNQLLLDQLGLLLVRGNTAAAFSSTRSLCIGGW